jgi:hypothetical protein
MVPPGRPTGVTLEMLSGSSLRVMWSSPLDNGGDTITKYRIDWDTASSFDSGAGGVSENTWEYLSLAGGAPFIYTIQFLTMGTPYYVRVLAYNSQGYGEGQASSPDKEHPRQVPTAPTSVQAGITSGSKLTVQWAEPSNLGGDAITTYKIEWDRVASFASTYVLPHKGEAEVNASEHLSYTISGDVGNLLGLDAGVRYYMRVSAANKEGYGQAQSPTPTSMVPENQVPGKPSSVSVENIPGQAGNLTVRWNFPWVPNHQIYCGGGGPYKTTPDYCPTLMGTDVGTKGVADGGNPLTKYVIEWDTNALFTKVAGMPHAGTYDFTDLGDGSGPFAHTLQNLDNTKDYYIRVYANNGEGSSQPCDRTGALCDDGASAFITAKPV